MKKRKYIYIFINLYFIFILSISLSCKKEAPGEAKVETAPIVAAEIDVKQIEDLTGVKFKILKTKSIGYMPLHKFYWCGLNEKISHQRLNELAYEIVKETIASKLKTYHSFTIHFFLLDKLEEDLEKSECCARATFLPEGSWLKIGRVPIDDYKSYKLNCTFFK